MPLSGVFFFFSMLRGILMKISKKDALLWFRFFAELPEEEDILPHQQEIVLDTLTQIETAVERRREAMLREIPGLKTLAGRTLYVGEDARFPQGCRSCLLGTGLSAVRKTNKCNIQCPFCYNYGELDAQPPIGEGVWEIGGTRLYARDLELLLSIQKKPTGVAYVYLEPFMEIEQYGPVIRIFHEAGIHQHMYTNGTLCNEQNLRALGEAGLDELRFNLGATNCADAVIEHMALAARFIPRVGIETPMTPAFYEAFMAKKDRILSTGIGFINCAELHLNANNLPNYIGAPMYMARQGYLSPIFSRDLTLKFMRAAGEEGWPVAVHDCSNRTKLARDLNLHAREGGWFGASGYVSEFARTPFEAFIPTLEDERIVFEQEEPLPKGYRFGDIVL